MALPICLYPPGTPFAVPGTQMRGRVVDGSNEDGFMTVRVVNGDSRVRRLTISPSTEVVVNEEAGAALDAAEQDTKAATRRRLKDLHDRAAEPRVRRGNKPVTVNAAIAAGEKAARAAEKAKIRKTAAAKAKKAPSPAKLAGKPDPRPCTCGCGAMTSGSRFLPGHDAKLKSVLRKAVRAGSVSAAQEKLIADLDWERFVC